MFGKGEAMAITEFSTSGSANKGHSADKGMWPAHWRTGLLEFIVAGGASILLLPLFFVFAPNGDANALGLVAIAAFWTSYVLNDPHFLVSYQLFYRDYAAKLTGRGYARGEQVRYWVAGIVLPIGMMVWIGIMLALGSRAMAAGMMQLMFILVGWHYVKQGYGVLTVLSARRGVFYSRMIGGFVIAHCLIAWVYAWFGFNTWPAQYEMSGVVYHSNALGAWPRNLLFWPFLLTGMIAAGLLVHKFWSERKFPPIAPILGLIVSVELWVVWSYWNESFSYFIPALHSLQYLYFVVLLERGRARAQCAENPRAKPVWWQMGQVAVIAFITGWAFFHWIPKFLDGRFGNPEAAYGGLIFAAMFTAFINIHHFAMDNVMWRRGNPDMRFLKG